MTTVKALILTIILSLFSVSASAQKHSKTDRKKWEAEMHDFKHDYLAKELNITDAQKTQFFALYDAMDRDRRNLSSRIREKREAVDRKANPTDAELIETARMDYQVSGEIVQCELKYFSEFQKVLTPKQLYKLRKAEGKIMRSLRKQASKGAMKKQ